MNDRVFQAYEYSSFNVLNEGNEGRKLPEGLFTALKSFSGEQDLPYYSLTAHGVRFKNYVGALQIGKWTIEVLPKIDRVKTESNAQTILIQMLKQAGYLKTYAPTDSNLKLKRNYILETYLRMYLSEVNRLFFRGLIKKYHKRDSNGYALKGNMIFNKHISKNLVHAERFYTRHTTYDSEHDLNRILLKTLLIISKFSISGQIISDTKSLLFFFPELEDIQISDQYFSRIRWTRKTEPYKKAIEIARLLLLNYHPDLSSGKNNVLALMFDMNDVWERWIAQRLKISAANYNDVIKIRIQAKENFWFSSKGNRISQKPDIVIETTDGKRIILDTKWKIVHERPSEDDLRQMYTYNMLFKAKKSFLVYPGGKESISGDFFDSEVNGTCALSFIPFIEGGKLSSCGVEQYLGQLLV